MYFLYDLALLITPFFLKIIALFHPKINLFVKGRKEAFSIVEKNISAGDKIIWVHTASLGEFEQGLPVIENLKTCYSDHKILLTFFSPSGYEVKKDTAAADMVCYLPLDTRANARRFVETTHPSIALFVKYEIWPNYLYALEQKQIPALLISAIFKKDQVYFKWYGGFMRKVLRKMTHLFVQDRASESMLRSIGIGEKITVSGDTRFDRVAKILERDNSLAFMESFSQGSRCLVAGSSWPEDDKILVPLINNASLSLKYILAPHAIKSDHIGDLRMAITKKAILYSEIEGADLREYEVLIVDTIGLLTKIYSYADIAYVGGGFATGLHNTLEPAVFGIPVIIGPRYAGFKEAEDLVKRKGIFVVRDVGELNDIVSSILRDRSLYRKAGRTNSLYIQKNKGAGDQIISYIRTLL